MAIDLAENASIEPIYPPVPMDRMAFYPSARFQYSKTITGDGTGGDVQTRVTVVATTGEIYYAVMTSLYLCTDEATASKRWWCDRYASFEATQYAPIAVGDKVSLYGSIDTSKVIMPQYLGKAGGGTGGIVRINYETNTNGKYYWILFRGFLFKGKPLVSLTTIPIF